MINTAITNKIETVAESIFAVSISVDVRVVVV